MSNSSAQEIPRTTNGQAGVDFKMALPDFRHQLASSNSSSKINGNLNYGNLPTNLIKLFHKISTAALVTATRKQTCVSNVCVLEVILRLSLSLHFF